MDGQSLIPLESINAVEVFTGPNLDDLLAKIRQETASIVPDVSTAGGRKEIASLAYKVARSKTTIDDAGKSLVEDWKNQAKVVDAARKKARDYLDALKDEVRKPLDDWEAEQARIEQEIAAKAEADRLAAIEAERQAAETAAAEMARREAEIAAREAAIAAKEKAAADALAAEQAAKARAEREEAIRKEAAAKAERDAAEAIAAAERAAAEAKAKAERDAEAAKQAAIAACEKAARDQAEAIRQTEERARKQAEQIERDRLAAEERERVAEEKRAANKRHAAKINNEVVADLVKAGCTEETAKLVVIAIASGRVAHTSIAY
ncbi:MAG TPA: hypothetical protein VN731_10290 [Rhodanobacter sp.]|nr:hypothetical protein [Rhodanobacter sp.]